MVLSYEEATEHMAAPGAVRCPLPHLLGMPLVMVPLGEDLRLPNKGAYQALPPVLVCLPLLLLLCVVCLYLIVPQVVVCGV